MSLPKSSLKKFAYDGEELICLGHRRATAFGLEIDLGLRGTPGASNPYIQKHPKTWWEAQIRLHGLECDKWTVQNMKKILTEAVDDVEEDEEIPLPIELVLLEAKLKREYEESEKVSGPTTKAKKHDPIPKTTEILRLTSGPVNAKPDEHKAWADKMKLEMSDNCTEAHERQLAKMNSEHAKLLASPKGAGNDVFGTWQFDCPQIIKGWCHLDLYKHNNIIWKIHPPLPQDSRLWCHFTQIIVEGVASIDWESTLTPNRWYNKKLNFTFRGRETGESDFVCDDDCNKGWIMFTSEHECHGMWEVQFGGEAWPFTGKKISTKVTGKKAHTLAVDYDKLGRDYETTFWF